MRKTAFLLVLSGIALADEAPKERTFKDGKLSDPYWGLTYTAPGLEQGMAIGGGRKVFEGRCTGGAEIEIEVQEGEKDLSAAEWMALVKKQWAETRKMQDNEETETSILFMEESLAGFKRHHGYAFHARGPQAYIVHATVNEKSETSGEAIKAALKGLALNPEVKPALLVYLIAKQRAVSVDDPKVLLTAGLAYVQGNQQQRVPRNIVMAERVLEQAIREAKPETYGPDELWFLHENIGLATLEARKLDVATGWLAKSEQLSEKATAPGAKNGQSSYNLACAYSLAGKIDEAFAALDRCVAKGFLKDPKNVEHMKIADSDLENLRKDPRWEAYFKPAEAK